MAINARGRRIAAALSVVLLGLALLLPASAAAARQTSSSINAQNLFGDCSWEIGYTWYGFGAKGQEAYSVVAMYLREPGENDLLLTFSQQADNPLQNAKVGGLTYRFLNQAQLITSASPSPDAQLVFKAQLIVTVRHVGTVEAEDARAETAIAIPSVCLLT